MVDFIIQVVGKAVAVRANFDTTKQFCKDYLWDGEPDFSVEITAEDLAYERAESEARGQRDSAAYLEVTALLRKISGKLPEYGALMFHGSAVAVDGVGYLFTAPSGTGKSTHTRLWRQLLGERAVMINDDKPFLQICEEGVMVCGSPWTGKHRLGTNTCVPLKAICLLERGEANRIRPIHAREAVPVLLQQSGRPRDVRLIPLYMELLDRLASHVTFYRLQCNMDPCAAQVACEAMLSTTGKQDAALL